MNTSTREHLHTKSLSMPSPRILFLDHTGTLGGAELYLLDVATHYRSQACVALFEDGPFRARLEERGVPVRVLPAAKALLGVTRSGGLRTALRAMPALARLAWQLARLARRFDLVYANSQKALVAGALASTLARRPLAWNLHDILTADHFSALNRRVAVAIANACAARVVVNSRATQHAFAESGGDRQKTTIAYNGLAPEDFAPTEETCAAARQVRHQLGLGDAPVVGVFSRLASWKGQHVLIEALPALPGVHALLVGGALFQEDRAYEERLHRLAETLDVRDRVHFAGFQQDVAPYLHAADVVAHTSVAPEPFGRVIVEGMLAEKPVVATRAGGALEIVDDGRTGHLVPPADADALTGALADLFEQPDEARRMAQAGREAARTRFSKTAMLRTIDDVVRDVHASKA